MTQDAASRAALKVLVACEDYTQMSDKPKEYKCFGMAGLCPKFRRTYGEPHECGGVLPLGHEGQHKCIKCGMEFNSDSVPVYCNKGNQE